MDVAKDLKIINLTKCFDEIFNPQVPLSNGWVLKGRSSSILPEAIYFNKVYGENKKYVCLLPRQEEFYVPNAGPIDASDEAEQARLYNELLTDFTKSVLRPLEKIGHFEVVEGATQEKPINWFGSKAADLLESFVDLANKSTLHPYDRERFRAFVIEAWGYENLSTTYDFSRWLLGQGFPHDVAEDLESRLRFGLKLLSDFDKR